MRQRREALGLSQGRLGRHLGLTFSQVQKYEKGSNRIGAGRLYQIAGLLGVQVGYFFEGLEGGGPASGTPASGPAVQLTEHAQAIVRDFLAIEDEATRNSLLALVHSLVAPARSSV